MSIKNNSSTKIIAIGNAITDILCKVDNEYIQKLGLNKGSMSLIDKNFLENFKSINIDKLCSGGSAGNTIATLAQLGNEVDFIGNVADDYNGKAFIDDLKANGANYIGSIDQDLSAKTASSYILITPDAERTMCTFLGCASNLNIKHLNENSFKNAAILYIEGYLWDMPSTIEALKSTINVAKKNQVKIAFSLSDVFCIKRHYQDFVNLVKDDADIIFANEDEILSLTQINNFNIEKILEFFKEINTNKIIVITRGDKGCCIIQDNKFLTFPTTKINNILDTTGAGDNFASGFLHNFVKNKSLEECANYGNFLAGKIIQKIGARFNLTELNK